MRRSHFSMGISSGALRLLCILWLTICFGASRVSAGDIVFSDKEKAVILGLSPLPPVPADPTNKFADDPRAARLGQFLFFERRLSSNGKVSCATCHDPDRAFADGKELSEGVATGVRHTAALWNVAYNRWFFWDGRADTLWAQALHPIEDEKEMASSRVQLARLVHSDGALKRAYENLFGAMPELADANRFPVAARPVSDKPDHPHNQAWDAMRAEDRQAVNRVAVNVAKSIAAYERRLVSRDSAFDRFVAGMRNDDRAKMEDYSPSAQRGLKLFIGRGNCRLCHSGPNFSDGEFHDTRVRTPDGGPPRDVGRYAGAERVLRDPLNARGEFSDEREGAAAKKLEFLANSPQNWGLFKTPTLRNVALTAPYMHQGQLATLRDVIVHYSEFPDATASHHPERILVPLKLTDFEVADLLAFLESLNATEIDAELRAQPDSPHLPHDAGRRNGD